MRQNQDYHMAEGDWMVRDQFTDVPPAIVLALSAVHVGAVALNANLMEPASLTKKLREPVAVTPEKIEGSAVASKAGKAGPATESVVNK